MAKPRIAFCLRGAVSLAEDSYEGRPAISNSAAKYVDYEFVYKCIQKHIVQANPEYDFDFFLHSWTVGLKENLDRLYVPVRSFYENNLLYDSEIRAKLGDLKDYSQVSQALAIKKVLELKESYEYEKGFSYNAVILYRPDVVLWADLPLHTYDRPVIYVNGHPGKGGDFHFVMSSADSCAFKHIYDYISPKDVSLTHRYIKYFVEKILSIPFEMDAIVPGVHQEVLRKMDAAMIAAARQSLGEGTSH